MCSNSIDVVGKHCKDNKKFYSYKNMVNVIPLAMVDDLLAITRCGMESIDMNTTINSITELKKLRKHAQRRKSMGTLWTVSARGM